MDNVPMIKKRQWRPRRVDDQQQRARNEIRLIRLEDPLKAVQRTASWSEPKPANDRFHWSKPKFEEATANKQSSIVQQQSADKLAGFLKKRSFNDGMNACRTVQTSDVTKKSRHTCDDKHISTNSRTMLCSPLKEHTIAQDSVHCDIKHRTVLGPATKPPCSRADKRSVDEFESDDDFDYSLDLMGEYTLKVSDVTKKSTPFWFESVSVKQPTTPVSDALLKTDQRPSPTVSLDTTCLYPQQFTPEIDLGIVLDTPQDVGEFDIIINSRRGYTYINYSKHRGTKRRIAYDDEEEDPTPLKRSRPC